MKKQITITLRRLVAIVVASAVTPIFLVAVVAVNADKGDGSKVAPAPKPLPAVSVAAVPHGVASAASAALVVPEPAEQAARRADMLKRLMAEGAIERIQQTSVGAQLWVRGPFYLADFRVKQMVVALAHAECVSAKPGCDYVAIYDTNTGKRVGAFNTVLGLVMD